MLINIPFNYNNIGYSNIAYGRLTIKQKSFKLMIFQSTTYIHPLI